MMREEDKENKYKRKNNKKSEIKKLEKEGEKEKRL